MTQCTERLSTEITSRQFVAAIEKGFFSFQFHEALYRISWKTKFRGKLNSCHEYLCVGPLLCTSVRRRTSGSPCELP